METINMLQKRLDNIGVEVQQIKDNLSQWQERQFQSAQSNQGKKSGNSICRCGENGIGLSFGRTCDGTSRAEGQRSLCIPLAFHLVFVAARGESSG